MSNFQNISLLILSVFLFYSCGTEFTPDDINKIDTIDDIIDPQVMIVKCPDTEPGDIFIVDGVEIESVNRELLIQRRDEGVDLTKVCVSLVTDMSRIFYGKPFNQPIGNWDVSSVTNMGGMFSHSPFNRPIGQWDVSSVTEMRSKFSESRFNQNISDWCVLKIQTEPDRFSTDSPITFQNKPKWGTCPD